MQLFNSIHVIFFIVTTINIMSNYMLTFYFSAKLNEQAEQQSSLVVECGEVAPLTLSAPPPLSAKQDRGG